MRNPLKIIIEKLLLPLALLGTGLLIALHTSLTSLIGATMFFVIGMLFVLLLCIAVLSKKRVTTCSLDNSRFCSKISATKIFLLTLGIVLIYLFALYYDLILGYRFYSVIAFFSFPIMLFLLRKIRLSVLLSLFIIFFVCTVLSAYIYSPPSLGNDTWRDTIIASTIVKNGDVSANYLPSYPVPFVPLIYSITAAISSIAVVNSSALIGVLYILVIAILIFLNIRNINSGGNYSTFIALILALSIPFILVWSVAYIPQANAIVMFLFLLLILTSKNISKSNSISTILLFILFACAIIFSHGGINLWAITFLCFLLVIMKVMGATKNNNYVFIRKTLPAIGLVTLTYFIFTTILNSINTGLNHLSTVIYNFLSLTAPESKVAPVNTISPEATALLCYGPVIMCVAIAFFAWLSNKPKRNNSSSILKEAMFLFGVAGVALGFLGIVYLPVAVLDRYLLLGSLILLVIISSNGFHELLSRGKLGKAFVMALSVLSIISIAFGATLTADLNPFNVLNSFSAQAAPPSWSDGVCINTISLQINSGSILTDWRTGLSLVYSIANQYTLIDFSIQWTGAEIHYSEGFIQMPFIGYSGLPSINYTYVAHSLNEGAIFIYRANALDEMNLIESSDADQMRNELLANYNLVYSGTIDLLTK